MSDTSITRRLSPIERPDIILPDGTVLTPRAKDAASVGVCDKTAWRWNLPTTYIANVAYVVRGASAKKIAGDVRPRLRPINQQVA